jgi:outer membrane protein OmpA-like peptidoglycan-associated protein
MTWRKENAMKMTGLLIVVTCAALICGCAATVPSELANARLAYQHASAGPATELAPADLHQAQEALAQAERSYSKDAHSYHTLDLAYVAQRKAEMAEAQASIAAEQKGKDRADNNYQVAQGNALQQKSRDLELTRTALAVSEWSSEATAGKLADEQRARLEAEKRTNEQSKLVQATSKDLDQTRTALAVSEQNGQATAEQLAAEQRARLEAEKKASEAQAELAKLSEVKEDARGMVITLSGSVLFRSDEAILMPGADSRLDQVVDALSGSSRNVLVEGYTDSQGSDKYNMDLSQRRADAVRDYFLHRGLEAGRVQANGVGEGRPVADNATAEGRANNRRVEIVLQHETKL